MLDDLFGISSGYVLDFTNRTFAEFFEKELGIDIYDNKYAYGSGSKGRRLYAFLDIEPETLVARALRALWEYREFGRGPSAANSDTEKRSAARFFQLVHSMDGKGGLVPSVGTDATLRDAAPPAHALAELNGRLLKLTSMKAHERGFAFERFLTDLFGLYKLDPRRSFRLVGEQIDGSFELPPDTFLLEAKWQDLRVGQADLLTFAGKVDGKAQWSRGLFVSYTGFSEDGLHAFAQGRRTGIICLDGLDLTQVLSGGLNFVEVLQRKKRRAAETGRAFVPVRELFISVT